MAKGENSIDRTNRLIEEWTRSIENDRAYESDIVKRINEIDLLISKLQKERDDLQINLDESTEDKIDAIYTKMALMQFVKNGGGLDMYVEQYKLSWISQDFQLVIFFFLPR